MPAKKKAVRKRAEPQSRQDRATATRGRICAAAEELFRERGFAATTMEAVAKRAGVAVQTVYFSFRTKSLLLLDVIVRMAHGPLVTSALAKPVPAFLQTAMAEPDPQRLLALSVEHGHDLMERFAPVWQYVPVAAEGDPEFAARFSALVEQRRAGMRGIMAALEARGALRVSVEAATDTLFMIRNPELILLARASLGWSSERQKAWTWELLVRELLCDSTPRPAAVRGLSFEAELT